MTVRTKACAPCEQFGYPCLNLTISYHFLPNAHQRITGVQTRKSPAGKGRAIAETLSFLVSRQALCSLGL
jgi:hypothetical protein